MSRNGLYPRQNEVQLCLYPGQICYRYRAILLLNAVHLNFQVHCKNTDWNRYLISYFFFRKKTSNFLGSHSKYSWAGALGSADVWEFGISQISGGWTRPLNFEKPTLTMDDAEYWYAKIEKSTLWSSQMISGGFYGGVHLLLWEESFPNRAQRMLWRVS